MLLWATCLVQSWSLTSSLVRMIANAAAKVPVLACPDVSVTNNNNNSNNKYINNNLLINVQQNKNRK